MAEDTWREAVRARLQDVSWDAIRSDVQPFLERSTSIDLLNYENLRRVLAV